MTLYNLFKLIKITFKCSMLNRKINNSVLWDKIHKLRELIKLETDFNERICWNCSKKLNIYDFLSDNVSFTPEYVLNCGRPLYWNFIAAIVLRH